jgi:hypothetical protein
MISSSDRVALRNLGSKFKAELKARRTYEASNATTYKEMSA